MFKKNNSVILFFIFATISYLPTYTQQTDDSRFLGIFDDFNFFGSDDDDDAFNELLDFADAPAQTRIDPDAILIILKDFAGEKLDLLQQPFFILTNPLSRRNILDLPVFEPQTLYPPPSNWIAGGHLFWNKTSESNFTKEGTGLGSYLALFDPTFLGETLEKIDDLLSGLELTFDIPELLNLFKDMTVEDRKLGIMFHAQYFWENLTLRFLLPLYYSESNLNFTNEQNKDRVLEIFGISEDEMDTEFQDMHFVSDQLGLGDLRFELDTSVYKSEHFLARAGGMCTVPSAFALKKGLKGTHFEKRAIIDPLRVADLDLDVLFDLTDDPDTPAEAAEIQDKVLNFLVGALDHLNANLLDTHLGNRHFGIGGFVRTQTRLSSFFDGDWASKIYWSSRLSAEYLFPRNRRRFFIKNPNPNEFAKRDFCDAATADENLTFVENELTDRLFPMFLNTRVQPGIIFHSTSKFTFHPNKKWTFILGNDMWLQTKESFGINSVSAPNDVLSRINVPISKAPRPYQWKIIGGISYEWQRKKRRWLISLNGDSTMSRSGIGDDYSASINIEAHF